MKIKPASVHCRKNFESKEHLVIGVSPFNSYFSEDRIFELAKWGAENFNDFQFFIPDKPSEYTLMAMGYSSKKAEHKARRQANYLKNKTTRSLSRLGISDQLIQEKIVDWEALEKNPRFNSWHSEYKEMYYSDTLFKNGCIATTKWVLEDNMPKEDITDEAIEFAVQYFLCEAPLFFQSPQVFEKSSSVFCYHKIPTLLKMVYNHRFLGIADPNQGFVVVSPEKRTSKITGSEL